MPEPGLAERMAKVEGILEEIRSSLDYRQSDIRDLNLRFDSLRKDTDDKLEALRKGMRSNFLWLLGVMLGILILMWVSIILTILIKG